MEYQEASVEYQGASKEYQEAFIPEAATGSLEVPTASAARLGGGLGEDWGRVPTGFWTQSRFRGINFWTFFRKAFLGSLRVTLGARFETDASFETEFGVHLGTVFNDFPYFLLCFLDTSIWHIFFMIFG